VCSANRDLTTPTQRSRDYQSLRSSCGRTPGNAIGKHGEIFGRDRPILEHVLAERLRPPDPHFVEYERLREQCPLRNHEATKSLNPCCRIRPDAPDVEPIALTEVR
jgi:hypothetical protein